MRSVICTNFKEKLLKIVWLNEDAIGVYVGMYGKVAGLHFSYHTDGRRHLRLPDKNEPPIQPHEIVPISRIDPYVQIISQTIVLGEAGIDATAFDYTPDPKATAEIFMPSSIFREGQQMIVGYYLLKRDREDLFIRAMTNPDAPKPFDLAGLNLFSLDNFKEHKCAVVFLSNKPSASNHTLEPTLSAQHQGGQRGSA